ncbi:hypothetical protein ACLESO_23650 [Pyxidicoccus sp. 3LG]
MTALSRNALALLAALSVSTSAMASETWVDGRAVLHACVYAYSYEAEVSLSYRNYTLPWGTSVYLIYGWGGISNNVPMDWDNTQTLTVSASAPYTWSATVRSIFSNRTTPQNRYDHVDFVWKVVLPNGFTFYEKGNGSTWGYYSAALSGITDRPCSSDGSFIGPMFPLTVTSVEKW